MTKIHIAVGTDTKVSYNCLRNASLVIENGLISWVGSQDDLPSVYSSLPIFSFGGRWVTPALIDSHTHIVFGGHRAHEFEMRLEGASYEEIALSGGGIISTVTHTRKIDESILLESALRRARSLIAQGVATIEVKSGYGLDIETELKMLRVAREIPSKVPIEVVTSFLGAHSVPKGMDADIYIDDICIPALEQAHDEGLIDAVDGFCEAIAFSPLQITRVFDKAKSLGLRVKLHAEQLSHQGGTALAAKYNALSADHLEYATSEDVKAMASSGTVAIILPGAFYNIRKTQKPPIQEFRDHCVPMAIATDWNPGSSPMGSLLLAMNMASTLFGLTPEEALFGVTKHAAKALGLRDRGMIGLGMRADLAVWDIDTPAELSYHIGYNPLYKRIYRGEI